MRVALIVNPYAGRKNGKKALPIIEKKLELHQIETEVFTSLYSEHISKIASELYINRFDAIICVGGDGTNYQVLNGLLHNFKSKDLPPLGIIPVGSGNSFAKDLGIHSQEDGIKAIIRHQPKSVDVCSFSQDKINYYFVNLTGVGFVTDVAKTAQKFKYLKDFSYLIGVLYRTINLTSTYMELNIDGKKITGENCFVEFCNSKFTGGDMMMAPDAKIDDGLMDIIIVRKLSRSSLIKTLPKLFKGTHIHHPKVRYIKAKKASVKTWPNKTLLPDGELFGATPSNIKVHPKMVKYLI